MLLRHGQASFGAADYDALSELGREQAAVAGAELAQRGLRDLVVVSGTLSRQRDTAEIAATEIGLGASPSTDSRWNEYDHVGMVTDHADGADVDSPESFQAVLDVALESWVRAAHADGWTAFSDGAVAALRDLVGALQPGRDAVVSTSGGVIAAVCGHLLSAPPEGIVALNRVTVNAACTTLAVGGSGISLISFNDHAHFTGARAHLRTYR